MFRRCENLLEAMLQPPHPPQKEVVLAAWAMWKSICWAVHRGEGMEKVDLNKVAHQIYEQKVERAGEVEWLIVHRK